MTASDFRAELRGDREEDAAALISSALLDRALDEVGDKVLLGLKLCALEEELEAAPSLSPLRDDMIGRRRAVEIASAAMSWVRNDRYLQLVMLSERKRLAGWWDMRLGGC